MIRKRFYPRPEVESLESMCMLSGFSMLEHPGVTAMVARETQASNPIDLSGTLKGTYKSGAGVGATTSFKAKGALSPLGKVTLKGSINFSVKPPLGAGTMTLKSVGKKHGTITASLTAQGLGNPVFYDITGSTGIYAGDTGSEQATFSTVAAKGKGPSHGKVTITFMELPPS
jgi:hypothetical protein